MDNTLVFAGYVRQYETFEKYEYVVIDTRNDSNLITNNLLVASDPSSDGFEALMNLAEHVSWFTGFVYRRELCTSKSNVCRE